MNLGLDNLASNLFCQSSLLNNATAAIAGSAIGGGGDVDSADEGCIAESTSGDSSANQVGVVNVGNVNVDADKLAANAFCQSEILNYLTASVLGHAVGSSSFGSGLLGGGPGGLLSGLLTADADVLANVLVLF